MTTAPMGWAYATFPLATEGEETLDLRCAVEQACALIDHAEAMGDLGRLGPVPHWAHHLKIEQSNAGDWPARLNARTGEPLGPARTLAPSRLMERLETILQSTEYAECIARACACQAPARKESNG